MVCKARPSAISEHLAETKLTPRGWGEIFAANDVRHALHHVVNSDRELVRPIAVAIEQQEIAVLPCRLLLDGAQEQIVERLDTFADSNPQPTAGRVYQTPVATEAVISLPGNMLSQAVASVHVVRAAQPIESVAIHIATVALPQKGMQTFIGLESKPSEVPENARFVFGPAADPIVILHAQQHTAVHRPRQAPHVDGVDDVAEVKMTGRGRGVAREHLVVYRKFILH